MPEVMRFLATRLRHFVADRRSARRFQMRLQCTVGLALKPTGSNGNGRDASLEGFTCDISSTGLGLLMPAIHIQGHYLTEGSSTLLILLESSEGPILLHAVAVRYEPLETDEAEMSYLIGARITKMSEENRVRLDSLLRLR